MEERQVTIDGEAHPLDEFFTVFATQNPLEFEGTYPLPEAQLDRFLLKIRVAYPTLAEERAVLERHHASVAPKDLEERDLIEPVDLEVLTAARAQVRAVQVEPALFDYLLALIRRTREWPTIALGASPRASATLLLVAKGYAAREGRDFLIPDDVKTPPAPSSAIASACAPKPNSKASTPTASSPTSSPPPPCPSSPAAAATVALAPAVAAAVAVAVAVRREASF